MGLIAMQHAPGMRSLKRDEATFDVQVASVFTVLITNEQTARNLQLHEYLKRRDCYSERKQ